MRIDNNPRFTENIHRQLIDAVKILGPLATVRSNIPVWISAKNNTNRQITLAAPFDAWTPRPFTLTSSSHPSGMISVGIHPEPGFGIGVPVMFRSGQPDISSTSTPVGESMHFGITPDYVKGMIVGFDGEVRPLHGLQRDGQELLVAQVAGLYIKNAFNA